MTGATPLIMLCLILASRTFIIKKQVPLTYLILIGIFLVSLFPSTTLQGILPAFSVIFGGLCGSLAGFLTPDPSTRSRKTDTSKQSRESIAENQEEKTIHI
jgi:hypothetical protein